jgi:alpha-L-arabinofuranosidase
MHSSRCRGVILLAALVMAPMLHDGVAQTRSASVSIDATKPMNLLSPRLYGQFVEVMFGGVDGSLWDELIRNRSFEEPPNEIGLSRDWQREPDDRNHDPAVHFAWADKVFYPPSPNAGAGHSMRIDVTRNQWEMTQRRGISQSRIPVRKAVPYRGYLWLKGSHFDGFVTVALERDRTEGESYASTDLHPKGDGWTKYEFTLTSSETDPLAKFSILIHGTGTIWIDQVSLMPGDAVAGAPAEVFQKIRDLHPSFIRWPGGNVAQDYHWMRGIGPRDSRPSWVNRAWWNEIESSDYGTNEFIALCKALGTQPSITVNVEGSGATAEEAANWVEYANGPATSKYGRMRADDGHPEPYRVKLWEVGNEVFGEWEIGHTDAATYARNFNRYAAAMKAVDPTIHLIAVGHDLEWNRTLIEIAGKNIDEIAIHHYYGKKEMQGDVNNLLAHPKNFGQFLDQMREMLARMVPDKHIQLNINEWNTSLPVPEQHTMESALYAGGMLNVFERHGDIVGASAASDLVNGWSAGLIQVSREELYVTPTYLVNKLYSDHLGKVRFATQVQGPTFDSTLEGTGVPVLDCIATLSADGTKLFLHAVNRDQKDDLAVKVHVAGAIVGSSAELESVTAASTNAENSFRTPGAVSVRSLSVPAGSEFTVQIPSDSVSVLTLHVSKTK